MSGLPWDNIKKSFNTILIKLMSNVERENSEFKQINIKDLNLSYQNNLSYYNELKKDICNNIDGRICHHAVLILNVLASNYNICNYLEIGTHNGTSMSYIVNQNVRSLNCYGIDLFENNRTPHYKKDNLHIQKTYNNIQKSNLSNSNINLIKGNCQKLDTITKFSNSLQNNKIDLFFIDGDHRYQAVKADFENYFNFLNENAIIVFDDYNRSYPGVVKFCDTDLKKYNLKTVGLFRNNELILVK